MTKIIIQQPRWLLSVVLFGFVLTIGLILLGGKGSEIAGPLGLFVAIISAVLAVKYRPRASETVEDPTETPEPTWWVRIAIVSTVVLVFGGGAGVFYAGVIHKIDIRVTDRVEIVDGPNVANGNEVIIRILDPPLGREFVAMTLRLRNLGKTGNCVGPTRLEVAPVVDGSVGSTVSVANMEEFRLSVAGAERAAVQVKTVNEPEDCTLDLKVVDAVLYNDFPW
ncbi:MAG: hypothetical protein ACRDSR_01020 [Pseudonocardiaceae bacterium]